MNGGRPQTVHLLKLLLKADKMWGCLWLLRIRLPVQGVGIQSLVGGLRSHTLWSSKACVHNKDPV